MFNPPKSQLGGGFGFSARRWVHKQDKDDFPCKDIDLQPSHLRSPGKFSFGTSRSAMQKLHIDKIVSDAKKGAHAPSPDTYDVCDSFRTLSPRTPSLGARRHILETKIQKSSLPGPGSYTPGSLSGLAALRVSTSAHRSIEGCKFGKSAKICLERALRGTEPGPTSPVPDFISPRIQKAPVGVKFSKD